MILYCFISHNSVVLEDYKRILRLMKKLDYDNYLIFYGGKKLIEDEKLININCNDGYCGLPDKVNKIYKYVSTKRTETSYIIKLDRMVDILQLVKIEELIGIDYCGKLARFSVPNYHFRKCEKSSKWYDKEFNGEKILYCQGVVYLLSKKAFNILANDESYEEHVYEDYYVGYTLKSKEIFPKNFLIKKYFYDPEHKKTFL